MCFSQWRKIGSIKRTLHNVCSYLIPLFCTTSELFVRKASWDHSPLYAALGSALLYFKKSTAVDSNNRTRCAVSDWFTREDAMWWRESTAQPLHGMFAVRFLPWGNNSCSWGKGSSRRSWRSSVIDLAGPWQFLNGVSCSLVKTARNTHLKTKPM